MAGKPIAKLTPESQTFVVQALACFDTPGTVAEAVRREFDIQITPQSIEAYDPTKRAGRNLLKRWRDLFSETRKAFLEDTSKIGIANRAVRLRTLQRMADKAEAMGNLSLAAQLQEQAAKEVGNAYTNTRVLTGPNGSALVPTPIGPAMTPKEAADAYADTLNAGG